MPTRHWYRVRSMKTWICISCLAVTFLLGNFLFLKPWRNDIKTNSNEDYIDDNDDNDGPNYWREKGREDFRSTDRLDKKNEEKRVEESDVQSSETKNQIHQNKGNLVSVVNNIHTSPEISKPDTPKSILQTNLEQQNKYFKYTIAILVIACNRPTVSRCLDQIIKYKPTNIDLPVIVSQDCGDKQTEDVIKTYGGKLKLVKQPDLSDVKDVPENMGHFMGYYKIARHYKWAINQAFSDSSIDSVIIVEDDLDIAPDFFEYFLATRPLLDWDKSLWCISAWNDNGKEGFVADNSLLYRTDFFPGLGWMITKEIWQELGPKWPKGFWDDWMRNPNQRKNRACIRPEISRSKTFGRLGVSQGQFYDQYLKFIKLNQEFYPFRKSDLKYLLKRNYDNKFVQDVYSKPLVASADIFSGQSNVAAARIQYSTDSELESLMRQFDLMTDFKAGVPRTAYKGIISFIKGGRRVYLTPYPGWTGYNEK